MSVDSDRLLFWVDFELVGTVEIIRSINMHVADKVPGKDVFSTWYKLGVDGP